uniref:Lon protease homolog n=1 Tax=Compsopogon caeruleus TaxID=31354 RepID=A0A7S1TFE0_9RHOD|mmetsp:Transcript_48/g.83  ORF Transcript_48/g.83 Transcript_48/m.83 type:complete len:823 (+) Transcript_48:1298-3766(+)
MNLTRYIQAPWRPPFRSPGVEGVLRFERWCSAGSVSGPDESSNGNDRETSTEIVPSKQGGGSTPVSQRKPKPGPAELFAVPLFRRPSFPGVIAPIVVREEAACRAFVEMRDAGRSQCGLFLHKDAGLQTFALNEEDHNSYQDPEQLHRTGVLAEIVRLAPRQKGVELIFVCHHRIRWTEVLEKSPLLLVRTEPVLEEPVDIHAQQVRAYSLEIVQTLKELLQLGSFYKEQLELLLESIDINNPFHLADLGACLTTANPQSLQEVLEETQLVERLSKTLTLVKAELETVKVQRKINKEIEESVSKAQRKFFLTEQLKNIKKELGLEKDEKEDLIARFRARLSAKQLSERVSTVIEDEIQKLTSLEPTSSEYNVTRDYLNWLTQVPWGVLSEDNLDISRAQTCLDEDHFGLSDVKERILEFIAVGATRGSLRGKILLLSGPPGVGKTSLGRSIARALGRQFFRFSVGGLGDVAEMKGHRRTYVGAMPGKLVQALKTCQVSNPVLMIDEIDKMGRGHTGDPASALLEILDSEQNDAFVDHYLDVPVDLSHVLFICTANVTDAIPAPLLDRMEIIRLSGYVVEEKLAIAKSYLIPEVRKETAMGEKVLAINEPALQTLIQDYCREPEFAGKPSFLRQRLYAETPPGIATGLAWTAAGGVALYVESVFVSSNKDGKLGSLRVTGQLGDVMKESAEIAFSYSRNYLRKQGSSALDSSTTHLHVPEGATPKDGPSAGITIVSSLLSLALDRPLRQNLAMTGEITLTGKVLGVGGIREKIIAAKREGLKLVILPTSNQKDWEELPEYVRAGLTVQFCESYEEVLPLVFEK